MLKANDIISTFVIVDDFLIDLMQCGLFLQETQGTRGPACSMATSEIITLCLLFQFSGFRNFKSFYQFMEIYYKAYFPNLLSYDRFITVKKRVAPFLYFFLVSLMGEATGVSFIDSTSLAVRRNKRIYRHKVFQGLATRGKTSMGWFFGFKLHIATHHLGELINFTLTSGNVDDRKPVPGLCKNIMGKLFGDRGYISASLFQNLMNSGVQLITNIRSNMKNRLLPLFDKLLLRKRFIIETTFGILKKEFHLEHSRHRSPSNFVVNLLGSLIAYCLKENKPSIKMDEKEKRLINKL